MEQPHSAAEDSLAEEVEAIELAPDQRPATIVQNVNMEDHCHADQPFTKPSLNLLRGPRSEICQRSYREVRVLVMHWGHRGYRNDNNLSNYQLEIHLVVDTFESYNYNVATSRMCPEDPCDEDLAHFHYGVADDTLAIIYYIGHGALDDLQERSLRFQQHVFLSSMSARFDYSLTISRGESLDPIHWYNVVPMILKFKCDVLTILDCSHSGGAALPRHMFHDDMYPRAFSKEVIATAGFDSTYWSGKKYSFATIMSQVFADFKEANDLDSLGLFSEISYRMKLQSPCRTKTKKEALVESEGHPTNPVQYQLVPGKPMGIPLKPLPSKTPTRTGKLDLSKSQVDDLSRTFFNKLYAAGIWP
ncbi:hypothetical protein CONLIGDRAFT_84067 [Coniochaeta ligniaria NRRL 30616]|uniref:Uncharacterized protein n=1 Tax=Coniochaeta ligniaria NRRL 30616 TaxID=1408157 RepID=A0A1J7ID26_9PEZI|nr:hypothetical protein CONLIGDRAFT_84067 [Coniochaeta ligniaria NRRL 30616]